MKELTERYQEKYLKALKIVEAYEFLAKSTGTICRVLLSHDNKLEKIEQIKYLIEETNKQTAYLEKVFIEDN